MRPLIHSTAPAAYKVVPSARPHEIGTAAIPMILVTVSIPLHLLGCVRATGYHRDLSHQYRTPYTVRSGSPSPALYIV